MAKGNELITGKTTSGFEFEIDPEVLDDWELVELFAEANSVGGAIQAYKMMLGKEQYERLKEHCRTPKGRVSTAQIEKNIDEIVKAAKPVKN